MARCCAGLLKRRRSITSFAHEHAKARARLEELNEHLETHLAMLRQDQLAGGQIQQRLLPESGQRINGIRYDYCLSPSLYLSGDFLEYQAIDERFSLFYFADVSGHGASSAFVAVMLKLLFARAIRHWEEHYAGKPSVLNGWRCSTVSCWTVASASTRPCCAA